jgi:nitrite reductase (NADH) small subunit
MAVGVRRIGEAGTGNGNMANWTRVAAVAECPPGRSLEVVAADRLLALYNVQGTYFALDGVCPHQGGPLGKGELRGPIVTCPWHGWQFDVRTGCHPSRPRMAQPRFAARVEGDSIYVDVDSPLEDACLPTADE